MSFYFPIRVYIEDTDAGGIVYHANHIKFCERARSEWLRAQGIDHYLHTREFLFVVHDLHIQYHQPIVMDDLLQVSVDVVWQKAASFGLNQVIWRDDQRLASVQVSLACLDQALKPRRLPPHVAALINTQLSSSPLSHF